VVIGNNKNSQRNLLGVLEWSLHLSLDRLDVSFQVKFLLLFGYWKTYNDLKFSISGTGTSIIMAELHRSSKQ
jgi:hypothetical protein